MKLQMEKFSLVTKTTIIPAVALLTFFVFIFMNSAIKN